MLVFFTERPGRTPAGFPQPRALASTYLAFRNPPPRLLAGNCSMSEIAAYVGKGFDEVLPKPFDQAGLQAALLAHTASGARPASSDSRPARR